ncbi:MAG: hypothetical protein JWN30_1334 [Bacilli bacterium]|nr:hypothetical protein [Bacilli bacterium]
MKYAFMTFSCPELNLREALALAKRYGYQGIEPRSGGGHKHGIELDTTPEQRSEIRRIVQESGIELSCLAISAKYADPATLDEQIEDTKQYIKLASDVGAPNVRVFGGILPKEVTREQASEQLERAFGILAPIAAQHGVTIVVETHDNWSDPAFLVAVLEKVNHPAIGINWDVYHPLRRVGLSIDEAFHLVKPWLKYVHFHDGMDTAAKLAYMQMGTGQVDHSRIVELLLANRYDGFLSGEWINWEPYDVHLPREIAAMKAYENQFQA